MCPSTTQFSLHETVTKLMSTLLVLSGLQDKGALQAHALKRYDDM